MLSKKITTKKTLLGKQSTPRLSSQRLYRNIQKRSELKKYTRKKSAEAGPIKVRQQSWSPAKRALLLKKKKIDKEILEKKAETAKKKAERKHPYRTGYYDEDRMPVRTFRKRVKRTPATRLPDDANKKLNVIFYKNIDPVYNSFWLGRFINTLQRSGKKIYASREVYLGLSLFKYSKNTNPLIYFFEVLDKIKPTLKLRNYLAKRGQIKKYPVPVLPAAKIMVATHWLKQELKNTQDVLKNGKISISLSSVLANFKENEKKNTLAEKRKQYMRECIMGQFNVRFLYRSR